MRTRAALQTAPDQRLIVDEIEVPDPLPDQVVVKLASSGVCHSQLHGMHDSQQPRPMVLGHEGAGVVTAVGRDVTHLSEGDHAIVTWVPRTPQIGRKDPTPVGATYREELVHGLVYTWGEDSLANADYVVPISKEHPMDLSSIVGCAVLTGAGAVLHTAKVRPGDSVAVFGAGGVGLCAIQMAALLQAYPIIAVDLQDSKLDFAREFGATHTVNASREDPVEAIRELTGGAGVHYAFEAIGLVEAPFVQSILCTRKRGITVWVGHAPIDTSVTIDARALMNEKTVIGSLYGSARPHIEFPRLLQLYKAGKLKLDELISRRFPLDEVNAAFEALGQGEVARSVLSFD